jgi:hypothetical protein
MAEECKYTYVDGGPYGHSFGWCAVHGVHACCSPVGTTYGGGGASTLDNQSLDPFKRITELEYILRLAVEERGILDWRDRARTVLGLTKKD